MSTPALANYTPTIPASLPAGGIASYTYVVTPHGGEPQPAVTVNPASPVSFPTESVVTITCHFTGPDGVAYIDAAPLVIDVPAGQTPAFAFTLSSFTPAVA